MKKLLLSRRRKEALGRDGAFRGRRIRVLFLDSGEGAGGSSSWVCTTLKLLDRERFDPFVGFYYPNGGPDTSRIQQMGVPVVFFDAKPEPAQYVPFRFLLGQARSRWIHRLKVATRFGVRLAWKDLPRAVRMARFLRREAIDVVVLVNDIQFHVPGAVAVRLTGTPAACRKAGGIGATGPLRRLLVRFVDLFIPISVVTMQDHIRSSGYVRPLVKIHEGVDTRLLEPCAPDEQLRRELGVLPGWQVVGYMARIAEGKGQPEFIEAAALVLNAVPDCAFLIVGDEVGGDGRLRESLEEKSRALGLERQVIFSGWREDVREVLSTLDVFVHCPTTWIEGLGIANLEAMAMGKPTVVSANGGLVNSVINGVTGFVVPIGDVPATAAAIQSLLEDRQLATRMGQAARLRVLQEFDASQTTRQLEAVLRDLVRPAPE